MQTEEEQILDFVRSARVDTALQEYMTSGASHVVQEQKYSPAVAEVVMRLVPHLTVESEPPTHNNWWR